MRIVACQLQVVPGFIVESGLPIQVFKGSHDEGDRCANVVGRIDEEFDFVFVVLFLQAVAVVPKDEIEYGASQAYVKDPGPPTVVPGLGNV